MFLATAESGYLSILIVHTYVRFNNNALVDTVYALICTFFFLDLYIYIYTLLNSRKTECVTINVSSAFRICCYNLLLFVFALHCSRKAKQ